ncbi:MAG: phosphoribosylamine--glycine ligase [Crocinitomix sp.]|nr:phosphoribosylamine--glycine ligase [Crocinitomix sp.]
MNVLVLGSGGREHAIAWKIAQSSQIDKLFIAPGNAGTGQEGTNVDLDVNDFEGIKAFCLKEKMDFVFVGPEGPLVNGIHDYFLADEEIKHIAIIGPNKEAAQLEGSKDFSKKFMKRHNIPTAKYQTFTKDTLENGYTYLESLKPPYVLKADGLAAGKGVLILDNISDAKAELKSMLSDAKFGDASSRVVIEEFLDGIELSVFVVTDGRSYKKLPEAKDYKRIGEGDTGLNTGGMGAVSPVAFAKKGFMDKVENQVIIPTVKGLIKDGIDYQGIIFFGLINVKNDPFVIEYNCRMGDPETEVVIPRLKSDILELFEGVATRTLSERDVEIDERTATTVMMVSGGYPNAYEKEKTISGLTGIHDSIVFHAGTKKDGPTVLTAGGRVLSVTSYGKNKDKALKTTYDNVEKIKFDKAYYRKDIGHDIIEEKK